MWQINWQGAQSHIMSKLVYRLHGDGLLVAGLFFTDYPPPPQLGEDPVEDPGLCDPPGEPGWHMRWP